MFDAALRPLKDRLLAVCVRPLVGRVHPNAVTLAAFGLGLGSALCLGWGAVAPALGLWLGNRLLDGMDGLLARLSGTTGDQGGYLDIVTDFVVYAAIPVALVLGPGGSDLAVVALLMMSAFYVNAASWMYLSALLEKRRPPGGSASAARPTAVAMPGGLVEGAETVVAYTVLIVLREARLVTMAVMGGLTFGGAVLRTLRGLALLAPPTAAPPAAAPPTAAPPAAAPPTAAPPTAAPASADTTPEGLPHATDH